MTTQTLPEVRDWKAVLPPYKVLLHNDDHNAMDYVVLALLKSVPDLTIERATEIMLEAHHTGVGLVTVCPLEPAELYRDRIQSFGLGATIERA
jgi:ATP-dependent Clp protease adaptor protein ClpS